MAGHDKQRYVVDYNTECMSVGNVCNSTVCWLPVGPWAPGVEWTRMIYNKLSKFIELIITSF